MSTLFKSGTIITASDMVEADVLVEGEIVTLIGRNLSGAGHEVVDCAGMYLLPGGIDVHTHLDLPFGGTISNDDFDVGHKSRGIRRHDDAYRFRGAAHRRQPA